MINSQFFSFLMDCFIGPNIKSVLRSRQKRKDVKKFEMLNSVEVIKSVRSPQIERCEQKGSRGICKVRSHSSLGWRFGNNISHLLSGDILRPGASSVDALFLIIHVRSTKYTEPNIYLTIVMCHSHRWSYNFFKTKRSKCVECDWGKKTLRKLKIWNNL